MFTRRNRRSAPITPSPIRSAPGRAKEPPPSAKSVILETIARVGQGLAFAGDDGGGLTADACQVMAAELRVVYRTVRSVAWGASPPSPEVAAWSQSPPSPPAAAAPPPRRRRSRGSAAAAASPPAA